MRPLPNHSTFLPSPSLGSWNHTGSSQFSAVSPRFLFPALFHHSAANPKMIFNWFKSTKPPERVGISPGAPGAPEALCSSLARSFLCSPVRQELLCLRISTGKAVRVTLFPAHCWHREFCSSPSWIYNSSSKLCQEDCSSMDLLSFADRKL